MLQYLRWAANTALFVVCCFLSANIANSIFAAMLTPSATGLSSESAVPAATASKRGWEDREVILSRNLFNSSTLAHVEPEIVTEELEETKLPLTLLGTAAATVDFYSWAVVNDRDSAKTKIVRVGDEIRPTAIVMRIERRRIVLDENGLPRELVLKEKKRPRTSSSRAAAKNSRASAKSSKASASSRRRTSKSRRPPLALPPKPSPKQVEEQLKIPRSEIEATLIDPGDLLKSARFTPKFEGGQMVGLQIHDPQPGSLFEQADIASGDVIIQINGVRIDSAEQSQTVLSTFDESEIVEIIVLRDGKPVTKTISIANP